MLVADLLRAAPGALVYGLLPGLLLATALVPAWRWWERLAMAPGMSAGFCGLAGLLMHDVGVGFAPATMLPVIALLVPAAVLRARRRGAWTGHCELAERPLARRAEMTVVAAALVAGVATAVVALHSLSAAPVPVSDDPTVHGQMVQSIITQHDALAPLTEPVSGSAVVRDHPGFECVAALTSQTGGPGPATVMLPVAILGIALIPLGLAALVLTCSGDWRVAAVAPLVGIGMLLASWPVVFGEYPYLVDSTLVVPAVLGFLRLLEGRGSRDAALLLGAAATAIWVVHGLEAITAALVGTPIILGTLIARRQALVVHLRRVAVGVLAIAVGMIAARLATHAPAVAAPRLGSAGNGLSEAEGMFSGNTGVTHAAVVNAVVQYDLTRGLGTMLLLLGIVFALQRRMMRWAIVGSAAVVLMADDVAVGQHLRSLWIKTYPFSGFDRILGIGYWVLAPLMALGLVGLVSAVTRVVQRPRTSHQLSSAPRRARVVAGAFMCAFVGGMVIAGIRHDASTFDQAVIDRGRVSRADLTAMAQMARALPTRSIVLNNGLDDAGMWIDSLTPDLAYYTKSWLVSHPDDPTLTAVEHACDDPGAAQRAITTSGARAVFIGSRSFAGGSHRWRAACLEQLPMLKSLARVADPNGGESVVLEVMSGVAEAGPQRHVERG